MTDDRQLPIQPDPGPAADREPDSAPTEPGPSAAGSAPGRRQAPPVPPLPPPTRREPSSADERPRRPEYRGEELDPERGPGLGCFWFQVLVLGFFIVIIPVGLNLNWPFEVLAILLFVVIGLLLLTGQTVIFLLRLVAADRRSAGRRRPLASTTKTVGEMEDELGAAEAEAAGPMAQVAEADETASEADATAPEHAAAAAAAAGDLEAPAEPSSDATSRAEAPARSTESRRDGPETAPDSPAEAPDEPDVALAAEPAADASAAEPAADAPAAEPAADTPAAEPAAEPEPRRPEEPDAGVRQ